MAERSNERLNSLGEKDHQGLSKDDGEVGFEEWWVYLPTSYLKKKKNRDSGMTAG